MKSKNPLLHAASHAFSLIELLSVVAIVGMLASMTVPALASLVRGGDTNRAVSGVAGVLDLAREYAIAKNTHTWVVLASDTSSPAGANLYAVILGSLDGSNTADGAVSVDLDQPGTYDLSVDAGNISVLRKAMAFPNAAVEVLSASPAPAGPLPMEPNGKVKFRIPQSSSRPGAFLNGNPGAQRVIQFSPNGQARVLGSLAQVIEVGIKSMKGNVSDEANAAAIQVSGLTGRTQVYRR